MRGDSKHGDDIVETEERLDLKCGNWISVQSPANAMS